MLRVRLAGDHSDYHCGSWAVWRALEKAVAEQGARLAPRGEPYDLLVVNGEGSMHHGTGTFRKKMEQLQRALDVGKRAALVNSVWQDNPPDFDDVLRRLSFVVVREVRSQAELRERHGVGATVCPDLCYFAPSPEPTGLISGALVTTDFYSREFESFAKLTGGPISRLPYLDMKALSWAEMLQQLDGATLITGRHHAVYAACRARAPFITTLGNSHKLEGLFESAGVGGLVATSPSEALIMARDARERHAETYATLFDWLDGFSLRDAVPLT